MARLLVSRAYLSMKLTDVPPAPMPADMVFLGQRNNELSREDFMRLQIPTIEQAKTMFRPAQNFLMILPLPEQGKSDGGLILPDRSRIKYNEGHIIARGPTCIFKLEIGDFCTWAPNREYRVACENNEFILIDENAVIMTIPRAILEQKAAELGVICPHCLMSKGVHKSDCPCTPEEAKVCTCGQDPHTRDCPAAVQ